MQLSGGGGKKGDAWLDAGFPGPEAPPLLSEFRSSFLDLFALFLQAPSLHPQPPPPHTHTCTYTLIAAEHGPVSATMELAALQRDTAEEVARRAETASADKKATEAALQQAS